MVCLVERGLRRTLQLDMIILQRAIMLHMGQGNDEKKKQIERSLRLQDCADPSATEVVTSPQDSTGDNYFKVSPRNLDEDMTDVLKIFVTRERSCAGVRCITESWEIELSCEKVVVKCSRAVKLGTLIKNSPWEGWT